MLKVCSTLSAVLGEEAASSPPPVSRRALVGARQVHRRVDQADVRERLREVANLPPGVRVVLLRQEAHVVTATQAITLEWVKCRRGPRTSQMPSSGLSQAVSKKSICGPSGARAGTGFARIPLTLVSAEEIVVSANVTVFTRAGCEQCGLLKEYLDRRGVTYAERDVTRDPEALAELRLSL
jgi:hypothetical protein